MEYHSLSLGIFFIVAFVAAVLVMLRRKRVSPTRALLAFIVVAVLALGATAVPLLFSRMASHQATSMRPPSAGEEGSNFVVRNNDFEQWQRDSAIVPGADSAPHWVENAGGSTSWEFHPIDQPPTVLHSRWPERGRFVGYSRLDGDRAAARQQAIQSAASQLAAAVFKDMSIVHRALRAHFTPREIYEVSRETAENLLNKTGPLDEYAESVQRDYGRLHRVAVLIDGTGPSIEAYHATVAHQLGEAALETKIARRDRMYTIVAAIGLALVVLILYVFLNAGTKGHFAWPLRLISLGALALLYLGMSYIRGWLPLPGV